MNDSPNPAIEPLFAHNARLWLRVWVITQAAAIVVSSWAYIEGFGGLRGMLASPTATRFLLLAAALVVYHVVGFVAYGRIMRHTWTVLVYVPLSWILILGSQSTNGAFSLLILGAILQGFIFLPFGWAAVLLGVVTAGLAAMLINASRHDTLVLRLMRVGLLVATGVMIATVLLYIHRANRETALRTRLLKQLDEAQRDLADRARESGVIEERQRFARDIHDTLAQGFASVIKHLEAVELAIDASDAGSGDATLRDVRPHLTHAQGVSRASLAEIRRLVHALRPGELSEAQLAAALGRIVAQWGSANGVEATFTADELPRLEPDADVILLRATQEALSNVARHANARHVTVGITSVDGLVLLTIEDDGRGFAQGESAGPEQLGLTGMRERVRRVGGHLLIESSAGAGTSLTVALPLSSIAAAHSGALPA